MKHFENLLQEERENILSNKITTELVVKRSTINFENIEYEIHDYDVTENFEVPPIIMDNKHLAQIVAFSGTDNRGRWIRTMLRTYMQGGRVLYRKMDDDNFIVTLEFK